MEMGTGRQAGGAHLAQGIPSRYRFPYLGIYVAQMVIAGQHASAVVDDDGSASYLQFFGEHYDAGGGRDDDIARFAVDVDPAVIGKNTLPIVASGAELRRDRAVDGPVESSFPEEFWGNDGIDLGQAKELGSGDLGV